MYIVLSYVTYVLLAVITSALLFGLGALVVVAERTVRSVWAHEVRHEIVRHYRASR